LPPPLGSKNEVFKFRSVSNIVIAPARTGRLKTKSTAVIITAHRKRGIEDNQARSLLRAQKIVQRKLIAPIIEEAPARCKEKIAISTPIPE